MCGRESLRRRIVLFRALAVTAFLALCAVVNPVSARAQGQPPWMNTSLSPDERVSLLLPQMTLEEKVNLMTGDPPGPAATGAYFNAGIPRLGIPELRTSTSGQGSASPESRRRPSRWISRPRPRGTPL